MSNLRDFIRSGTLIDTLHQDYTDATSGTYTVPAGVSYLILSGCGGGGGGGGGGNANSTYRGGGAGGAGAAAVSDVLLHVAPGDTLPWSIGNKGSGGAGLLTSGSATSGSNGGDTQFGTSGAVVILAGGLGGPGCITSNSSMTRALGWFIGGLIVWGSSVKIGSIGYAHGIGGGSGSGGDDEADVNAVAGAAVLSHLGGFVPVLAVPRTEGGGGGASVFGQGGDGAGYQTAALVGQGYGSGGGGGEGSASGTTQENGKDGSVGFIYIRAYG
jgi:hypothetical protein